MSRAGSLTAEQKTAKEFDPILIICQIVSLQSFFYLSMTMCLSIIYALLDIPISLDHLFNPRFNEFVTSLGWIATLTSLFSAVAGAYLLSLIVEKSKKCVDFTFTLYLIHLLVCCYYKEKLPLEWEWWIVNIVSSVTMASVGEYLCSRNELEDIPLYTT